MTTIRSTCPDCGEVDMGPESILLSLTEAAGSYRFCCPECRGTVEKPADRRVAALLLSAGVALSDDAGETRARDEGDGSRRPPFSVDDLIAFRALLNDDGRLRRALSRL